MTPVLFIAITLCLHDIGGNSLKVSKRQVIDNEQLVCITNFVHGRIDDDCLAVVVDLADLYDSSNPLGDISTHLSQFPVFCRPSCGQVLVNAWQSCGAFDDIASFTYLLTGMCATNAHGRVCYNDYNALIQFLIGGISCTRDFLATRTCSSECSVGARDAVQNYGCCVNVVLDFVSSLNDRYNNNQFDQVFSECQVHRPQGCTNNPLMISAASHVSSFLPISTVCLSAAAALM